MDMIIAALLILIILYIWYSREGFTNKKEKAETIVNWMKENKYPSFVRFRDEVSGGDVVDYSIAKRLDAVGNLTAESLEERL